MIENGYLQVSSLHKIYYETYGNQKGIPVLFIHGGPGGRSKARNLSGINLDNVYAILFDQRGCGKSLPLGEIKENTTEHLIGDIKKLLDHLKIKKTAIYAGSWGAGLGLLFAETFPKMISKMFLNCSFLARKADASFLYDKVKDIFPDLNHEFMKNIPDSHKNEPATYLFDEMEKGNLKRKKEIACLMANYEYSLMKTTFSPADNMHPEDMFDEDIFPTRIFLHYEANHFFIKDNQIVNEAEKIKNISLFMVHGRYDMDAPLSGAWELHQALPKSELVIVPYEGHSGDFKKTLLQNELNKYTR